MIQNRKDGGNVRERERERERERAGMERMKNKTLTNSSTQHNNSSSSAKGLTSDLKTARHSSTGLGGKLVRLSSMLSPLLSSSSESSPREKEAACSVLVNEDDTGLSGTRVSGALSAFGTGWEGATIVGDSGILSSLGSKVMLLLPR